MAWSVEARVPFTDFRLVEFAFSGACDELRIRNGWSKWGLRKAGAGVVPDSILWRRDKMGFGTPETDWLKVLLSKRGSTVTEPGAALHEFVDPESAKECVQAACGDSRKGPAALRLIVGEQWLRQLRSGGRSS